MRTILHIDFNSYFATLEQQANPRLRGKPIGVTGGDRMERTVLGTASIEAKKLGVKTGMQIWQAKKICPQIIIVKGDSDKYFYVTKKFLNILKDYSPYIEVFSIDESFIQIRSDKSEDQKVSESGSQKSEPSDTTKIPISSDLSEIISLAKEIKQRIRSEIGEWMRCSVGISYNRLMAKLASSLQKPDGLIIISNQAEALKVLDKVALDDICGIGPRIKQRLFAMGINDFKKLRAIPKQCLVASFKSYGEILYNMARGVDESKIVKFYEKEEVKSIGHRYTLNHDTGNLDEIRQVLLKISEMVAVRLRDKKMVGKTVSLWFRYAFKSLDSNLHFSGDAMQKSYLIPTQDGLEIFQLGWEIFNRLWTLEKIRMIGISISNLQSATPFNLTWLPEKNRQKIILQTLDKVNHKFGDFTLKRAILLGSANTSRKPNSYLADRRFKF